MRLAPAIFWLFASLSIPFAGCKPDVPASVPLSPEAIAPEAIAEPIRVEPNPTPINDSGSVIQPKRSETEIHILAWNVESGGSLPAVIASMLSTELAGYEIYALSEVLPTSFQTHATALGPSYFSIESTYGEDDRLQLLVDGERFELIDSDELMKQGEYRLNDGFHRSPLVAHLRDRSSGQSIKIAVNHLARGNADLREEQASGLREWARVQSVPTIAIGDFNFDYSFDTKQGNSGFAAMLRDGVWRWVEPEEWIDTNWFARDEAPLVDHYPNSILDFAFVAGPAKKWNPKCRVIVFEDDFPDDDDRSDHRPIELVLAP